MLTRAVGLGALGAACVALALSATNLVWASGGPKAADAPRDVTMEGRIVDLHCFMTGMYPSEDHAKCTADCLRAGVPAALETADGVFVLGNGMTGPSRLVAPHAFRSVVVSGKLYTKAGVTYLDVATIKPSAEPTKTGEPD